MWEYARRETERIKPAYVDSGPVKQVKMIGDEVDLTKFPICFHSEKDGGLYLTPGGVACADRWTVIVGNHASTSDDDVFGDLGSC